VAPIATLPHCFASHAVWLLPPCLFSWALAGKPARLDAKAKVLAFFFDHSGWGVVHPFVFIGPDRHYVSGAKETM
jgi:hypothetical protein